MLNLFIADPTHDQRDGAGHSGDREHAIVTADRADGRSLDLNLCLA
jgi:hypothetical protein